MDAKALMRELPESYTAGDADRAAMAFVPEGVLEDVATGHALRGREAIREYCRGFFAAWPDLKLEVLTQVADGAHGSQEWVMSATHSSEVLGMPASGKRFSIRGVSFYEFKDGLILHSKDYFDLGSLARQIAPNTSA